MNCKVAFLPKNEYLEKKTEKGIAKATEIVAESKDSHTVKANSLQV